MSDDGVHQSHCCALHGCKYGDDGCPVMEARIIQDHPCESCDMGPRPSVQIVLKDEPRGDVSLLCPRPSIVSVHVTMPALVVSEAQLDELVGRHGYRAVREHFEDGEGNRGVWLIPHPDVVPGDPYAGLMNTDMRDEMIKALQGYVDDPGRNTFELQVDDARLIIGSLERDNEAAGRRSSAAIEINHQKRDAEQPPARVAIWSYEHNAWWGANSLGYVQGLNRAGVYVRSRAEGICTAANMMCKPDKPHEVIVEIADMLEFQAREQK